MREVVLDLLLLASLSRFVFQAGSDIPVELFVAALIALPFFLGMGASVAGYSYRVMPGGALQPFRSVVGVLLNLAVLVLFVGVMSFQGVASAFWGLFLFTVLPYLAGRAVGVTFRALLWLAVILFLSLAFISR